MKNEPFTANQIGGTPRAVKPRVYALLLRRSATACLALRGAVSIALLSVGCSEGFTTGGESPGDGDGDGSGGASGTGGETATGGDGAGPDCPPGEVIFNVDSSAPDLNCLPSAACGPIWINLRNAEGTLIEHSPDCELNCGTCEQSTCSDGAECTQVPFDRQISYSWRGTRLEGSTCGGEQRCAAPVCVPAGKYTPEICLERALPAPVGSTECTPAGTLQCTTLPAFDWPSSQIITATLGGTL